MKKDKAKDRFKFKKEEIEIIFVPQCNRCKKNINGINCEEYKPIPYELYNNEKKCLKKSSR